MSSLTFTSRPGLTLTPLTWGGKKDKAGLGSLVIPVEGVGKHRQQVTCRLLGEEALRTLYNGCQERGRMSGQPTAEARCVCVCEFTSVCTHIHGQTAAKSES